jgi:hypothetical protein
MSVQTSERPSIAKNSFLKITRDPDPVAAIKRLVGATPPEFETEWLDFKGAAQINDQDAKRTWSKALAGFANTQGGVLIWGVDARKDQATGIDAACGLSLVKSPSAFKSRLNELHHQATEPPVLDVEIEAYSIAGTRDEGIVVCYIPESPFKPHRAEHAERQYFIRAGDDFVVPSVSLLRNLFFPQSRCLLVPKLVASCTVENGKTSYHIEGFLRNLGSATAFDTLAITHYSPKGTTCSIKNWETGPTLDPHYSSAKIPIHPGIRMAFFAMICFPEFDPQGFAKGLEFKIQVFARDAEPVEWLISFTESEVKIGVEKRGERRSLFFGP